MRMMVCELLLLRQAASENKRGRYETNFFYYNMLYHHAMPVGMG